MKDPRLLPFLCLLLYSACARDPQTAIDSQLADEIARIKAVDNHAHPVLAEPGDHQYDALPVESLEPQSDPLGLRPEAYKTPFTKESKDAAKKQHGAAYPAWVLDQMGTEIMLANRVAMGPSIQPPRFLWVPYADYLIFPLDNSALAAKNSDRKAFFALEEKLRPSELPVTLAEYCARIVTPTLERHRQGGAVAEKFEAAYLRSLAFDSADAAQAARIYTQKFPSPADYKILQDYLFRYIAAECGRLGMAVHLHTMAGAGSYFDVAGANPLNLEPALNDPALRKTNFVMVHGGWPFTREITALMQKPNAYLDFSAQSLLLTPATLAVTLREWLEFVPEKIMFGTDAYPYAENIGWEESGYVAAKNGREALARALTAMLRDGEITHTRAVELARLVLRDNALRLYVRQASSPVH